MEEEALSLVYASVGQAGEEWRVAITHPLYNAGAAVFVTGYTSELGAQEGAAWWDAFVQSTPPPELVCMSGARFERGAPQ